MDERFPWQQIIILLLIFGGSILKFIFQGRGQEENQPGQAGRPPGAKSPALEILEKIREQNESITARQVQAPASTLEREVEQEEDAYYGDDDLEGVSGLQSTEVPTIGEKPQPAAAGVVVTSGDQQQVPKKRRSGDRIPGTIRTPRAEVLQPHSTDLQAGVSAPRTSGEQVHSQDLEIEDDLAIHTSTHSGVRRGTRSLHLPGSLGGGQLSLRQAIIGQVILGPPKALEKQAGKQADPIRIP